MYENVSPPPFFGTVTNQPKTPPSRFKVLVSRTGEDRSEISVSCSDFGEFTNDPLGPVGPIGARMSQEVRING